MNPECLCPARPSQGMGNAGGPTRRTGLPPCPSCSRVLPWGRPLKCHLRRPGTWLQLHSTTRLHMRHCQPPSSTCHTCRDLTPRLSDAVTLLPGPVCVDAALPVWQILYRPGTASLPAMVAKREVDRPRATARGSAPHTRTIPGRSRGRATGVPEQGCDGTFSSYSMDLHVIGIL